MSGMTLQQVFVVEFTVANQMCDDCHRSEAQDYWRALVSILLNKQKYNLKLVFKVLLLITLLLSTAFLCILL